MQKLLLLTVAICINIVPSFCSAQNAPTNFEKPPEHALVGAWLATEGTLFVFRQDGTFHGFDHDHREFWGNWVALSASRIGFQGLRTGSPYPPQVAILDKADKNLMACSIGEGDMFVKATRIPVEKAETTIEVIVEMQLHQPDEKKRE